MDSVHTSALLAQKDQMEMIQGLGQLLYQEETSWVGLCCLEKRLCRAEENNSL